ncbi:MAG: metalloprotease PmbA [Wenzhouxiangellaceae bacterium]
MSGALSAIRPGPTLLEDREAARARLCELAEYALDQARAAGADQAEVVLSRSLRREVSSRLGEIDTLEEAADQSLSVTVYRGHASGAATSGDLSRETIAETVRHAAAIARHTEADPAAGLPDPGDLARELRDFDQWHPCDWTMEDLIGRAMAIERAGLDVDARVQKSEGAAVSMTADVGVIANSAGFVGTAAHTRYVQSCVLVAEDQQGMQRDWDWDDQIRVDRLVDPEQTGRRAAERALARLGARPAPSGRWPVLFAPETALGLIGHLLRAASGSSLYRRSSFLVDALGQQLFPAWMQIEENPHLPGVLWSSSFDSEGVATRRSKLIEDGRLVRYVLGSYSARKLGMRSTGNAGGVRNLFVQPGDQDFAGLVRQMGRGLIVTELMGQGVNLVTGDYSRGAAGFWIEDGEIAYPVEEITIASTLPQMYAGVVAAGSDVESRRRIRTPSLLIDSMAVAARN